MSKTFSTQADKDAALAAANDAVKAAEAVVTETESAEVTG